MEVCPNETVGELLRGEVQPGAPLQHPPHRHGRQEAHVLHVQCWEEGILHSTYLENCFLFLPRDH